MIDGGVVSDRAWGKIRIALRPAEQGKGWRYFIRESNDVEVLVATQNGKEIRLQRSIQVPAYLLPGEQVHSTLPLQHIPLPEVKRILPQLEAMYEARIKREGGKRRPELSPDVERTLWKIPGKDFGKA